MIQGRTSTLIPSLITAAGEFVIPLQCIRICQPVTLKIMKIQCSELRETSVQVAYLLKRRFWHFWDQIINIPMEGHGRISGRKRINTILTLDFRSPLANEGGLRRMNTSLPISTCLHTYTVARKLIILSCLNNHTWLSCTKPVPSWKSLSCIILPLFNSPLEHSADSNTALTDTHLLLHCTKVTLCSATAVSSTENSQR